MTPEVVTPCVVIVGPALFVAIRVVLSVTYAPGGGGVGVPLGGGFGFGVGFEFGVGSGVALGVEVGAGVGEGAGVGDGAGVR
jgi:hypothetical protein